ncbi:MAG: helix-turn-helix domain-containing protein [Clostridia bacterium]|nr:helix-turn-helix domain-containing protein [Clostridia bacterium]
MPTIRYIFAEFDRDGKLLQKGTCYEPPTEIHDRFFSLTSRFAFPNSYFICGHEKAPPKFFINTGPSGLKFHYAVRGKGTYNDHPFGDRSIFITRPNYGKILVADRDEPWEMFWCVWQGELAKSILNKLTRYEDNKVYCSDENIQLQELFRYIIYNPHHEKKLEKTILAFSEMLLAECRTVNSNNTKLQETQHVQTIKEIQAFINQNFRSTSVEEIAQVFHYNRRYLSSVFHQQTGGTIQDCIQDAKLRCAENYLLEKQVSMEEIALGSGYSNYSAFIKAFKKKYNMTPSDFVQFYSEL